MQPPDSQEPPATPAQGGACAPAPAYPVDALVSTMGGVVFVTTGQLACDRFGAAANQVALTPLVARRIAEILRATLGTPDLEERRALCAAWQEEENPHIPHGRVLLDQEAVHLGIEPLGAGFLVTVAWEHVPGLILQLEATLVSE